MKYELNCRLDFFLHLKLFLYVKDEPSFIHEPQCGTQTTHPPSSPALPCPGPHGAPGPGVPELPRCPGLLVAPSPPLAPDTLSGATGGQALIGEGPPPAANPDRLIKGISFPGHLTSLSFLSNSKFLKA